MHSRVLPGPYTISDLNPVRLTTQNVREGKPKPGAKISSKPEFNVKGLGYASLECQGFRVRVAGMVRSGVHKYSGIVGTGVLK